MIRKLVLAAMLAMAMAAPAVAKQPKVGQLAPDAEFVLAKDGTKVSLSSLRGQVVVINFWATWCVPCQKELPTLEGYFRAQKSHGLRVFAATTETSVPLSMMHKLFNALTIDPLRRLHGPYAPIGQAVPTNYVIDRAGVVRYAAAGAFDLDALNRVLVPLLRERAPADPEA
jgi:thiol-disulfide isomerase/thioredoxin